MMTQERGSGKELSKRLPKLSVMSKPWLNRENGVHCILIIYALFFFSVCSTGISNAMPGQMDAIKETRAKAERGDARAQYDLGMRYGKGDGVPRDYGEALMWLRKSAEQGYLGAQYMLGILYGNSEWAPRNYREAVKWLRLAADRDYGPAQSSLGDAYRLGWGGSPDYAEAARWYRKAADDGVDNAQFYLGLFYSIGWGVPREEAEAVKWFLKAAEQGHGHAQALLARCYIEGRGVTKDLAEAFRWFKKAAEQGDADAQFEVGLKYQSGVGVSKDLGEAVKWFRKAADQGQAEAQASLGSAYVFGWGVPKDYVEAAKWTRRAANQGNSMAQLNHGSDFANGFGVPQDYIEAYKWFNLAAAKGERTAAEQRQQLTRSMTNDQIAEGQRRSASFVAKKETASPGTQPESNPPAVAAVPKSSGSGFFVTADGYFLTNFHVVADSSQIVVQTAQGTFPAKLVKSDAANDLAILKVSGTFKALPLAASRGVKLGDSIFTIGFPNIQVQGIEPKMTRGEINSMAGIQDDPRYFQVSTPVQPGNSGGPLVDQYGNVVGIVTLRLDDLKTLRVTGSLPQNVNYALKGSFITAFLETVPEAVTKLLAPRPSIIRKSADVVKEVQSATALVLVY